MSKINLTFFSIIFFSLVIFQTNFEPIQFTNFENHFLFGATVGFIDYFSNAYFSWKVDPLYKIIGNLIKLNINQLTILNYVLFFLGLIILVKQLHQSFLKSFNCSLICLTTFVAFFGNNLLVSSILSNLCLAVVVLIYSYKLSPYLVLLIGNLIGFRLFHSAYSLAWVSFLGILILCLLLKIANTKNIRFGLLGILISLFATLFFVEQIELPNLPNYAHLVPDDGNPGIIRPLINASPELEVLDQQGSYDFSKVLSLFLLLVSCFTWYFFKSKSSKLLLCITILVVMHNSLTSSIKVIDPISTLQRLIPNAYFFDLTVFLNLIILLYYLIYFSLKTNLNGLIVLALFSSIFAKFSNLNIKDTWRTNLTYNQEISAKKIIASPALYALKNYQLEYTRLLEAKTFKKKSLAKFNVKAFTNLGDEKFLHDKKYTTRWSPSIGKQLGNEFIYLNFNQELILAGIELNLGKFLNDFPRGIKVAIPLNCTNNNLELNFEQANPIVKISDWQGKLNLSKENYPYFSAQSDVEILFPKNQKTSCLLIEQIGQTISFDWSVAEIKLILPN